MLSGSWRKVKSFVCFRLFPSIGGHHFIPGHNFIPICIGCSGCKIQIRSAEMFPQRTNPGEASCSSLTQTTVILWQWIAHCPCPQSGSHSCMAQSHITSLRPTCLLRRLFRKYEPRIAINDVTFRVSTPDVCDVDAPFFDVSTIDVCDLGASLPIH
jgi:hypothetical protein